MCFFSSSLFHFLFLLRFEFGTNFFLIQSFVGSFVHSFSLELLLAKQLQATELAIFRYIFIRCLCSVLVNLCDELFLMALPALDTIEHFNTHIFKWLTFIC